MKPIKLLLFSGAALAGAGAVCVGGAAYLAIQGVARLKSRTLRGKVVLITGSSRGLGLALAEAFAERGAKLVLTARDPEALERARRHLMGRGVGEAEILVVPADLRRLKDAEQLIEQATLHYGQVDVLVNNAGVITVGPMENQSVSEFRDTMDANFFSAVHCVSSVLPQMVARRAGTIVNIGSMGGKVAVPHMLPYTASKFALVGFSEGLHAELRGRGVHVLTVCPGLMRTGSHVNAQFTGKAQEEYRWFSLAANTPGLSTRAACAARRIVRAVQLEETEIAITPAAMVAARLSAVAPEVTLRVLRTANRFLPGAAAETARAQRGAEVRQREVAPAAAIGGAAARRYNQTG